MFVFVVGLYCVNEMKNGIYPLQKGCAKDIISPMGCNSNVRKGGGCVGAYSGSNML